MNYHCVSSIFNWTLTCAYNYIMNLAFIRVLFPFLSSHLPHSIIFLFLHPSFTRTHALSQSACHVPLPVVIHSRHLGHRASPQLQFIIRVQSSLASRSVTSAQCRWIAAATACVESCHPMAGNLNVKHHLTFASPHRTSTYTK